MDSDSIWEKGGEEDETTEQLPQTVSFKEGSKEHFYTSQKTMMVYSKASTQRFDDIVVELPILGAGVI